MTWREPLRPYTVAIARHRRLVVGLPIALALAATGASLLRPRQFAARAAFEASESGSLSGSLGTLSSLASELGIPGLSAVAASTSSGSAQFYSDLLTSQTVLRTVVTSTYDAGNPGPYDGRAFHGTLVEYFKAGGKTATDSVLDAMRRLARSAVTVVVDRPTGVVHLEVRTKNRALSAQVARRFLDLVNEFNLKRRQTQAGAERDFDAGRLQVAGDSLRAAEAALADFRSRNIDFSRSPTLSVRQSELERQVTMAQQIYSTVAQRYELARIEAVRNTPVVTVLDAPEGMVEALPRYTAYIGAAAFVLGALVALALALRAERPPHQGGAAP